MPGSAPVQLPRLLWLHRTLHEAPDRAVPANILDKQYETWELERKTKGRDLAELATWAGPGPSPLEYDRRRRTWSLTRPFDVPDDLQPRMTFSDPTTQVLQLSLLMMQATQGDGAGAVNLLDDLVSRLPNRIRHVGIFAPPRLGLDEGELSSTWNRLHKAIEAHQRVEFHYGPRRLWRRVDPLFLWWAQGGWYLLARPSNMPDRFLNFALARIDSLAAALRRDRTGEVPDTFAFPEDFKPMVWLGEGDWLYRGGRMRTARIRFDACAVPAFRDRLWQSDARWEDHVDGSATLQHPYPAREDGEWEMARKVLGWGEYCTVEGPVSLVKRVRELALEIARRHGADDPGAPIQPHP